MKRDGQVLNPHFFFHCGRRCACTPQAPAPPLPVKREEAADQRVVLLPLSRRGSLPHEEQRGRPPPCDAACPRTALPSFFFHPSTPTPPQKMSVLLETTRGDLVIDLLTEEAPVACRNFLKLCK